VALFCQSLSQRYLDWHFSTGNGNVFSFWTRKTGCLIVLPGHDNLKKEKCYYYYDYYYYYYYYYYYTTNYYSSNNASSCSISVI
jgi:hypothetical protein